MNKINSKENY